MKSGFRRCFQPLQVAIFPMRSRDGKTVNGAFPRDAGGEFESVVQIVR
jgi:hypothetical protein